MPAEIFISYRRADEQWARLLHARLQEAGVDAWYDAQVGAGEDWRTATAKALEASRIFVLLFTKAASESDDIAKELAAATLEKKLVVPVRLENIQPKGAFLYELASRNWINAYDNTEAQLTSLATSLAALVKSGKADPAMLPFDRGAGARPVGVRDWIRRRPLLFGGAVLAAAVLVGGSTLLFNHSAPATATATEARVAVLPFDTLSDGAEARHLADSLTDAIVSSLNSSRIEVVSVDDATSLRGPDKAKKVAELGVALTFDGTVQDDGKSVKVRVHLDDPVRHATLWTGQADGPAADSARLEGQIASTAAAVLACSNRAIIPSHGLTQPALLSRYLRACDLFTSTSYDESKIYELLGSLRDVTVGAPDFVAAHSDLAKFSAYFSAFSSVIPPEAAAAMRKEAAAEAVKAIALDPKSPDAYLSQEMLLEASQWTEREKLLRTGQEADPSWPHTNGFLGMMLGDVGRVKEGLTYVQRATAATLQIDWRPYSAAYLASAGDVDAAVAILKPMLAAGRVDEPEVWTWLFAILRDDGRYDEARAMLADPRTRAYLGGAFETNADFLTAAKTRSPQDIAKVRKVALATPPGANPGRAVAIQMLAMLGQIDDAFAAAATYAPGMPMSGAGPAFMFAPNTAPLRRDPRFIKLVAGWGMVDYWRASGHWPDFCAQPGLPYDCQAEAAKLKSGN